MVRWSQSANSHPFILSGQAADLDAVARSYRLDPADIVGIADPYLAHCFREAVFAAGQNHRNAQTPDASQDNADALMALARSQGASWAK